MEIYLVRHGAALDVGEEGITRDFDRPLSREGRRKTEEEAAGLQALGVQPDFICASPLVRAQETARILAATLCPKHPVKVCEWLQPGELPGTILPALGHLAGERVMAVGHMPDLDRLASIMLTGKDDLALVFKKGAVCCVSYEGAPAPARARLEWLMQPGQIRAIRA